MNTEETYQEQHYQHDKQHNNRERNKNKDLFDSYSKSIKQNDAKIEASKDYENQLDDFVQIHSDYLAKRKRIMGELEAHAKDKHLTDVTNRLYERSQFSSRRLSGLIGQTKVNIKKERKKLEQDSKDLLDKRKKLEV